MTWCWWWTEAAEPTPFDRPPRVPPNIAGGVDHDYDPEARRKQLEEKQMEELGEEGYRRDRASRDAFLARLFHPELPIRPNVKTGGSIA